MNPSLIKSAVALSCFLFFLSKIDLADQKTMEETLGKITAIMESLYCFVLKMEKLSSCVDPKIDWRAQLVGIMRTIEPVLCILRNELATLHIEASLQEARFQHQSKLMTDSIDSLIRRLESDPRRRG